MYFYQMFKQISSAQNPLIKELVLLKEKSRARKKSGRFIIEGQREISLALKGNYTIEKILFDASIINSEIIQDQYNTLNIMNVEPQITTLLIMNLEPQTKTLIRMNLEPHIT